MSGRSIFILGGIRSGKSRFAEELAAKLERENGLTVLYLATAEIRDDEMRERVRRHRASRPKLWETIERPLDPADAIRERCTAGTVMLLDCLNFYVSNVLLTASGEENDASRAEIEAYVNDGVARLADAASAARAAGGTLLTVSNEVGTSLVSPHELGRLFQELLGSANQKIASLSDEVWFLTAGIPLRLK